MVDTFAPPRSRGLTPRLLRFGLYAALGFFAVYFLLPLGVMISTSLKSLDEIHSGSLISLPKHITLDAWLYAWNEACIGTDCVGLGPHFWNSIKFRHNSQAGGPASDHINPTDPTNSSGQSSPSNGQYSSPSRKNRAASSESSASLGR